MHRDFLHYVRDVISYYTPTIKSRQAGLPANWHAHVFGRPAMQRYFGHFVANIFGLDFSLVRDNPGERRFAASIDRERHFSYSIITLNYDRILENFAAFINHNYQVTDDIIFNTQFDQGAENNKPALAKLHGCVEGGVIIPPTWAKGTHRGIAPVWKKAFEILEESNQIRFIGYSMPVGDAYIKYLLKSAVINAQNLKKIDVLCLDPYGDVKNRYESFINFGGLRFKSADTRSYLELVHAKSRLHDERLSISGLEGAHDEFMAA